MFLTRTVRFLVAALFLALPVVAMQLVAAPAAAAPATRVAPSASPTVLHYDASGAGEYQQVVDDAAQIWNESVDNVVLEPGTGGGITVLVDNGWPRTYPNGLGAGTVYMGREAMDEGYDATRVAAHELGHILGLPDNRTGKCSDLMSGHSAPTSCTNAHPSEVEAAQVEQNFAGGRIDQRVAHDVTVYDGCFRPAAHTVRSR